MGCSIVIVPLSAVSPFFCAANISCILLIMPKRFLPACFHLCVLLMIESFLYASHIYFAPKTDYCLHWTYFYLHQNICTRHTSICTREMSVCTRYTSICTRPFAPDRLLFAPCRLIFTLDCLHQTYFSFTRHTSLCTRQIYVCT